MQTWLYDFISFQILVFDTYVIATGKHTIGPDEFVFAAMQIFLDIILIFWYIIKRCCGNKKDKKLEKAMKTTMIATHGKAILKTTKGKVLKKILSNEIVENVVDKVVDTALNNDGIQSTNLWTYD